MERNDKCFCGSGIKYKKCHLRINGESKLANIYRAINAYDIACKEKNIYNACINGCSKCCSDFFFISENEFLMIVEELLYRKENINNYITKAKDVMENINKTHPDVIKKLDEYMPTSFNEGLNSEYFKDDFNDSDLPKCIFLNENNKCTIYDIRPFVCRTYGTTKLCEYIKNPISSFEEEQKMILESKIITDIKNSEPIVKRPYPIFYWFGFFLEKEYYYLTMKKVENIKNMRLDDYYNFNKIFIHRY